jgi:alanine racemase
MAVVKADAYGHGAARVAASLDDADGYAVARFGEALALRAAGIDKPILLLEGVFSAEELAQALAARIDLAVHDPSQVELLEQADASDAVIWLQVDTGMNRLGFRPEQVLAVRARLLAARGAARGAPHARFDALVAEWTATAGARPSVSIGNSAGTLRGAATQGDWIRPGIALYGASPLADRSALELGLAPVMTLETAVIAVREVPVGEGVGYGATWRATRPSRIAILAAGYADGVPRHLPSGAPVLIGGQRAPLAGRVSMDMIAVDVTDLPSIAVGERAVLWGAGLPVDEVAARAGTIAYEIFCRVAPRVPRVER